MNILLKGNHVLDNFEIMFKVKVYVYIYVIIFLLHKKFEILNWKQQLREVFIVESFDKTIYNQTRNWNTQLISIC